MNHSGDHAALAPKHAPAGIEQAGCTHQGDEPLMLQPGQVMRREYYEQLAREAATQE